MKQSRDYTALLNTETAASYLGVHPQTLRNWKNHGEGPPWVKIIGRVLYRIESLDAWVKSKEINPAEIGRKKIA